MDRSLQISDGDQEYFFFKSCKKEISSVSKIVGKNQSGFFAIGGSWQLAYLKASC